MTPDQRHKALIEALVGDEHRWEYLNSPSFKASVTTLAQLLPAMVGGLSSWAGRQDQHLIRSLLHTEISGPAHDWIVGLVGLTDENEEGA